MTDATSDFIAAMTAAGIAPVEPITNALTDGKLVRFRAHGDKPGRRNAWAVLHLDRTPAGCFGHYRLGIHATWRSGETRDLSRAERKAIAQRIHETEAQRRAEIWEARERAVEIWQGTSRPSADHPYLARKRLRRFGVRQAGADLIVPMVDCDLRLWNVQRIGRDGFKRFTKGGRTAGLFAPMGVFLIDGRPNEGPLVIAEGWATAAAIHEATGFGVAAAMSAKNLMAVAMNLRRQFPQREIIIAADNDAHLEGNIGIDSAREGAGRIGAVVAIPFAVGDQNTSEGLGIDFADIPRDHAAALINDARMGKAAING